ncbi:MAG TPA: ABC transporter permease [Gemmatimonadaceae bacterium]
MSRAQRITTHAIASLRANRARALLMMLGPAAGVAMLSAVIVSADGARQQVMSLVAKHGLDMIMVRAGGESQVFAPRADRGLSVLFAEDALAIEAGIPGVAMVSPVQNQRGIEVVARDRSVVTRAFGVDSDWLMIRRWAVTEGEFIADSDVADANRTVLLGAKVARELFPEGGALGQTVRVNNDPYVVKGLFIEMGASAGGDDWDDRIVVPYTTATRRLFNRPSLEQIVIRVSDASRMLETAERVRALLRVRHQIGTGEADDFFVREPEDVEGAALDTSQTLWRMLVIVAVLAVAVGGFATANLMLAGVSQRTQEIGLRRAAGARAGDITRQFVIESLLVTMMGGLVGVVVGAGVALGLASLGYAASRVSWMPFAAALVASVAIGIMAALVPARRAAQLDPAVAVRSRPA